MAQVTLNLAGRPAAGLWEALTLTRRSRPRPPQLTGRRGYGDGDIESPNDTSNVVFPVSGDAESITSSSVES